MVLHVVGQHTKKKDEIQIGTFEVASNHDLTAGESKTFNMGTDVEVTGISVRPEDSTYHAYVTYVESDDDAQILRKGGALLRQHRCVVLLASAHAAPLRPAQAP